MSIVACSVDGCENARRYANGDCPVHYQRFRKYGTYDLPPKVTHCIIGSCGVKLGAGRGRGFCRAHYRRWRKICIIAECSIAGCSGIVQARGWCSKHWSRWDRYGNPEHRYGYEVHDGKRVCAMCKEDKPLDQFGERAGKASYCMRCSADIAAERRRLGLVDQEKNWAYVAARRAQRLAAGSERFDRIEIFERDNWTCQLCGGLIDRTLTHPHPWHGNIDHVVPLSKGGSHSRENAQASHFRCNLQKGNRRVA